MPHYAEEILSHARRAHRNSIEYHMSAVSNMNKAHAQNRVSMVRLQYDKQKDKRLMPLDVWGPELHEPSVVSTAAEDLQEQQLDAAARPPAVGLTQSSLPPAATDDGVGSCEYDSVEDSASCQQQQHQGHEQQPATVTTNTHRASTLPAPGAHSHHPPEPIRSPSSPLTARRTLTTSINTSAASPVSPRSPTHLVSPWSPRAPAPPSTAPSCPPQTPTTMQGAPASPAGPVHAALLGRFSRRSAPDGISQACMGPHAASAPLPDAQPQNSSCHQSQLEQQQEQCEHQHLPASAGGHASPPRSARPGPRPASARPQPLPASGASRSRVNGLRVLIPDTATTATCNGAIHSSPSTAAGSGGWPCPSPQHHLPLQPHPHVRSRGPSVSAPLSPEGNRLHPWSSGLLGSFAHSLNRLGSSSLAGTGTVSGGGIRATAAAAAAASAVGPHDRGLLDGSKVAQEVVRVHRSRTEDGDNMPYLAPTKRGGGGGTTAGGVATAAAGGGSCWQPTSSLYGRGHSDLCSPTTAGLRPSSARNSASGGSGGFFLSQSRQQSSLCDQETSDLSLVVSRSGPAFTASASGSPLASRRASSGLGGPAPPSGCRESCSGSGNGSGLASPAAASRPVLHAASNVATTGGTAAASSATRPVVPAAAAAASCPSLVSGPAEEQAPGPFAPTTCHRAAVRQLQDLMSFAEVRSQDAGQQQQEQQQQQQQEQQQEHSRQAWASTMPAHQPVLTLHAHRPTPLPPGLVLGAAAGPAVRNARSASASRRRTGAWTQE